MEALLKLLDSVDESLSSAQATTVKKEGEEVSAGEAGEPSPTLSNVTNPIPEIRAALQKLLNSLDELDEDFNDLVEMNLLGKGGGEEGSSEDSEDEELEGNEDEDEEVNWRRRRRRRRERKQREKIESQNQETIKALEEAARLKRELEETKKATSERDTRLNRLHQAELQALRADVTIEKTKTQASIQDHERERSEARNTIETLKMDLETEVARRHNFEEEISHLRKEVEVARREMNESKREAGEEVEKANELESQLNDVQVELEDAKAAQADASGRIDALLSQGSSAEKELAAAQERIDELNSQLITARSDVREARESLTESENARDKIMRSYRVEADSDRAILEETLRTTENELQIARNELKSRTDLQTSLNDEVREQRETAELLRGQLKAADEAHEGIVRSAETAREAASEAENARNSLEISHQELLELARPLLSSVCELQKVVRAVPALSRSASTSIAAIQAEESKESDAQDQAQKKAALDSFLASASGASAQVTLEALRSVDSRAIQAEVKNKLESLTTLVRKWQKACKSSNEKTNKALTSSRERLQFRNFKVGDLALFLPTRTNASTASSNDASSTNPSNESTLMMAKPWAAFNISFPHYFLHATGTLAEQLKTKEWIVARITQIEDRVSDSSKGIEGNPFQLADGVRFYLLEVEGWTQPSASSSSANVSTRARRSSSAQTKENDAPLGSKSGAAPELKRRETLPSLPSSSKESPKPIRRSSSRQLDESSPTTGESRREASNTSIVEEDGSKDDANDPEVDAETSTSLPLQPTGLETLASPASSPIQSQRRSSVPITASHLSDPISSMTPLSTARAQSPGAASVRSTGPSGIARALRASSRASSPVSSRYGLGNGPPWSAASLDQSVASTHATHSETTAPAFGRSKRRNNNGPAGHLPSNALSVESGEASESSSTSKPVDAAAAPHRIAAQLAREALGNPFSQSPAGQAVGSLGRSSAPKGDDYFTSRPPAHLQDTMATPTPLRPDGSLQAAEPSDSSSSSSSSKIPSVNPLTASRSARRLGSTSSFTRAPHVLSINGNSLMVGSSSPSMHSLNGGINIPSASSSTSINSITNPLASPAQASATLVRALGESSLSPIEGGPSTSNASPSGSSSPTAYSSMTLGRAASRRMENQSSGSILITSKVSSTSPSFLSKTIGRMSSRRSMSNVSTSSNQAGGLAGWFSPAPNNESQARSPTAPSERSASGSQAGTSGFTFHSSLEEEVSNTPNATSPKSHESESASQMLRRLKGNGKGLGFSSSSGTGTSRIQAHPNFTRKGKGKEKE